MFWEGEAQAGSPCHFGLTPVPSDEAPNPHFMTSTKSHPSEPLHRRGAILYPAVLEHAAALIGRSPWEVSRHARLLHEAHQRAFELYNHSPIVSGIDVYHAEVEAWGVTVRSESANATPVLGDPLFESPAGIPTLRMLDPERDGRLPLFCEAASALAQRFPSATVQVPLAGPVSLAVGLLGFETVLMEIAEDTEEMRAAITFLARHQAALCTRLIALGFQPVIYDSGCAPPLLSPDAFEEIVAPALETILRAGRAAAIPLTCIIGGNVALIAHSLLATGPGQVICPAETDQVEFMRVAASHPSIAVRVNMPSNVIASGNRGVIERAIEKHLPLALGHPRGLLGTGVVPFDCDPALIVAAKAYAEQLASDFLMS